MAPARTMAFPIANAIVGGLVGLFLAGLLWLILAAPLGIVWTVPGMTGNRVLDLLFLLYFLAFVAAGAIWGWREACRHPTMAHGAASLERDQDHDAE